MSTGPKPLLPQHGRPETVTAQDGHVTWPIVAAASLILALGIFRAAHHLVLNEQLLLAGGVLVLGTLLMVCILTWNYLTHLQAQVQRYTTIRNEQHAQTSDSALRENKRMLATMGHEIRTPLNGVIGMLALLLETELTAEQKNYAAIAHGSGRTLLSILDEMLDRSKSEFANDKALHEVDLSAVIENVTELLSPRAHAKGIDISSHIASDVPNTLPFRDLHLRQVLFNLAGNAIKFTAQGCVSIRASLAAGELHLAIKDTGIGMTADEQARLFKEFAQANETTAKRFGGTGLGLVISKRLIESMGGQLHLESGQGSGTTFTITLPLQQTATLPVAKRLSGRHYVLLMADSLQRCDLQKSLENEGATATPADATEAELARLLNGPATAIIAEAAAAPLLHRMAKTRARQKKHIPQIWLALNAEERRSMRSILARPTTGYLMKPVRRSTLVHRLTEHDSHHVAQQATALRHVGQVARRTRKLRLLLVEDSPVNALLAKTLLKKAGHETRLVTTGRAALEVLAVDRHFDVVLMDVEMPEMNGYEATRHLRQLETINNLTAIPVLALTANAGVDDVKACLAAGMNGHVAKPFDRADLDEALSLLVARKVA